MLEDELELVSESHLSISCMIVPPSVDTEITILSHWTTPEGVHVISAMENGTNPMLDIPNVKTADSGDYTCLGRVMDSSGRQYVASSIPHTDTVRIIVSKSF